MDIIHRIKHINNHLNRYDQTMAPSPEGAMAMAPAVMRLSTGRHQHEPRCSGTLDTQGGRSYIAP